MAAAHRHAPLALSAREGGDLHSSPQRQAFEICRGVIAGPLPTAAEIPEHGTLLTARWPHREMHEVIPALPVHTIGAYYGVPSPRVWHCGHLRLAGVGRPGTVAVVPADWGGYWDIDQGSSLSYVMLSDARLQAFAAPLSRGRRVELLPRVGEPDAIGAHILRALGRLAGRPDRAKRLLVEQALDLLCTHLMRVHSSLGQPAARSPARGLPAWQLRRVTGYMAERLGEDVGLDELAELISLSRSHFCTAFRHATGVTPHAWLTRLRLERAQEMLRDPRMRIIDVGLAVGYQTPSAFTAAFRRFTGTSPSAYRRQI
ncbi:helix-turn-helix domain-containing protein [Geminicoccus flavidas]|uniref:helix-turn-helix domain-containing protein n=1 Tax=Geminicoccus flavidas TaxID=2506407 RepID=UPI0013590BD9|nr:AraC family transcriptional regulator [Geminicoccus flavidas]